ncbi:MAG: DUF6434 domain-containing protein [Pseudomonadota bacterium]
MPSALRPSPDTVTTREAFERWYWSVDQLESFCERLAVRKTGSKAILRARVAAALAGEVLQEPEKPARKSRFQWNREQLRTDTIITDNISFGPKVRRFFSDAVGPEFVCHGDFMTWVRSNTGKSLGDAVDAWWALEERKADPSFRREIASCNNYLQYLRDFRDANPGHSQDDAKTCWDAKKIRPAENGFVVYDAKDLEFLT